MKVPDEVQYKWCTNLGNVPAYEFSFSNAENITDICRSQAVSAPSLFELLQAPYAIVDTRAHQWQ